MIDDGVSGFIVDDVDDAVCALARLNNLDRSSVRARFETRFTVERMARDYVEIYERIAAASQARGFVAAQRPMLERRVV